MNDSDKCYGGSSPGTHVALVSLGCSKNTVDSEKILGEIRRSAGIITGNPAEADIIIVNTCGFLGAARDEALETIREMAEYKVRGNLSHLVVTGCMIPMDRTLIAAEIPSVDLFVTPFEHEKIIDLLDSVDSTGDTRETQESGNRLFVTPQSYGYLKISDGCDNRCAYCRIPALRGGYRSFSRETILQDARRIIETGRREIVIVSQDNTRYGEDLPQGPSTESLMEELADLPGLVWLRLMYMYPSRISDNLLDLMARHPKICRYLDIPLQHIDSGMLRRMHRSYDEDSITKLMARLREKMPDITLRTTLMTGFPGEDTQAFETMKSFVQKGFVDHLGVFTFSPEPGTPAVKMDGQVSPEIAKTRRDKLMETQQKISLRANQKHVGLRKTVLVDEWREDRKGVIGRMVSQAPEVDGVVFIDADIEPGSVLTVTITAADEYDCRGTPVTGEDLA